MNLTKEEVDAIIAERIAEGERGYSQRLEALEHRMKKMEEAHSSAVQALAARLTKVEGALGIQPGGVHRIVR